MTEEQKKLAERLERWLKEEGGEEQLREAAKEAQEAIDDLNEARRVDWRTLHEPMTI
jgi:hypothetical protein